MRTSKPIAALVVTLLSVAVMTAQRAPSPPKNLRIVSSGSALAATSGRAHEYFNTLVALERDNFVDSGSGGVERRHNYPLRSTADIEAVTAAGNRANSYFTYDFLRDPSPVRQDGAKFHKTPGGLDKDSIPGNQQLRMPIGIAHDSGDTILVLWDWFYGQEFRSCIGTIDNYKIFNVRSSTGSTNSGNIYIGSKIRFSAAVAPEEVGAHMNTLVGHGPQARETPLPTGLREPDNIIPTGAGALPRFTYQYHWGTWNRHVLEIRTNVLGSNAVFDEWKSLAPGLDYSVFNRTTWNAISEWVLDENRDATRVMYRVPWKQSDTHLAHLNFEFNTSGGLAACALIGYGRNAIVLRNYATNVSESDARIFTKPVR